MTARLRLYIRTGLVAIGILFGPDLLFGAFAVTVRLVRTNAWDQMLIVAPIVLAAVACALWALVAGHRYVRAWFIVLAVGWNLWAMLDMFKRAQSPWELSFALPWLVWTIWFSHRLVQWGERAKEASKSE